GPGGATGAAVRRDLSCRGGGPPTCHGETNEAMRRESDHRDGRAPCDQRGSRMVGADRLRQSWRLPPRRRGAGPGRAGSVGWCRGRGRAALLPDIDHPSATIARSAGTASKLASSAVGSAAGHRGATHTLLAVVVFTVLGALAASLGWTWDAPVVGHVQVGPVVIVTVLCAFA